MLDKIAHKPEQSGYFCHKTRKFVFQQKAYLSVIN